MELGPESARARPAQWDNEAWAGPDDLDDEFFDAPPTRDPQAPSLPIILFSAASGVAGGTLGLFVAYRWLAWGIELSAGIATLTLLLSLGISGALLTAATGSRAAPINILFSCGLILLALFFLGLCLIGGALVGTVLLWW